MDLEEMGTLLDAFELSHAEFESFVTECHVANVMRDSRVVRRVFATVAQRRPRHRDLARFQFVEALVRLSYELHDTELASRNHGLGAREADIALRINGYLQVLLKKMRSHYFALGYVQGMGGLREAIHCDESLARIVDHLDDLRAIFESYLDTRASGDTLSPPDFALLVRECELDRAGPTSEPLSNRELCVIPPRRPIPIAPSEVTRLFRRYVAFVSAQMDDEGAVAEVGGSIARLVFAEFVEAVARLGVVKWPNSDVPECVERAVHAVLEKASARQAEYMRSTVR